MSHDRYGVPMEATRHTTQSTHNTVDTSHEHVKAVFLHSRVEGTIRNKHAILVRYSAIHFIHFYSPRRQLSDSSNLKAQSNFNVQ